MKDMSMSQKFEAGDLGQITTYQAGVMQSTAHRLLQRYCDTILKPYGITKMHWLIIGTVRDAGSSGVRLTDLSGVLGTTLSYLTNTVNLLESKGILTRIENKEDSRSKHITMNESFVDNFESIELHLRDALRKTIYKNISYDDFRTYMKVLFILSQETE